MESKETANSSPVYRDRRGRMDLAIWKNETPNGVRYIAEITRSWKDEEEYQTTHRLDEQDLLPAAKLADVADDWIAQQRRRD
jgi:hypothetical protein